MVSFKEKTNLSYFLIAKILLIVQKERSISFVKCFFLLIKDISPHIFDQGTIS